MRRSCVGLAAIALVISACGGGGSACVPTTDISGIWSGTSTGDDVDRGSGTIVATITQSGCTLGGTWNFTFADVSLNRQLEVTGDSPTGPSVELDLKQCTGAGGACDTVGTCDFLATGTLLNGTEINGTYTTGDNCSFSENGSFDITLRARLTPTPTTTPVPTLTPTATPTPMP